MQTPPPPFPDLDRDASEPIYRQLYWRFREAIANDLLRPGERVPAARALAKARPQDAKVPAAARQFLPILVAAGLIESEDAA